MQSTSDRTVMVVPVTIDSSNTEIPARYRRPGQPAFQGHGPGARSAAADQRRSEAHRSGRKYFRYQDDGAKADRRRQGTKRVLLGVAPNPDLGTSLPYDGLLSTDLFVDADLDMDFGARRLTAFSTDHCDGRVVYWPANPSRSCRLSVNHNLITFPVTVNGHTVTAVMDTGAQYSVMNMKLANRLFGLTPGSPDMRPLTETSGEWTLTSYGHSFDDVAFEGVQVKNLRIYLMPDQMTSHDRLRHREVPDPLGLNLHREIDQDVTVPGPHPGHGCAPAPACLFRHQGKAALHHRRGERQIGLVRL